VSGTEVEGESHLLEREERGREREREVRIWSELWLEVGLLGSGLGEERERVSLSL
jgi:hypothetical protein